MQPEHAFDGAQFGRFDESRMGDHYRVERAVERRLPEVEKPLQFGEFGTEIVFLPDVGLKQPGMIGAPVIDVRGGQSVTGKRLI